jgi:hypothetical protein
MALGEPPNANLTTTKGPHLKSLSLPERDRQAECNHEARTPQSRSTHPPIREVEGELAVSVRETITSMNKRLKRLAREKPEMGRGETVPLPSNLHHEMPSQCLQEILAV